MHFNHSARPRRHGTRPFDNIDVLQSIGQGDHFNICINAWQLPASSIGNNRTVGCIHDNSVDLSSSEKRHKICRRIRTEIARNTLNNSVDFRRCFDDRIKWRKFDARDCASHSINQNALWNSADCADHFVCHLIAIGCGGC